MIASILFLRFIPFESAIEGTSLFDLEPDNGASMRKSRTNNDINSDTFDLQIDGDVPEDLTIIANGERDFRPRSRAKIVPVKEVEPRNDYLVVPLNDNGGKPSLFDTEQFVTNDIITNNEVAEDRDDFSQFAVTQTDKRAKIRYINFRFTIISWQRSVVNYVLFLNRATPRSTKFLFQGGINSTFTSSQPSFPGASSFTLAM